MSDDDASERPTKSRAHVFVEGRVQGVFFRDSTRSLAARLGVCGWVRNLSDGRVEVIVEGEIAKVKQLIEFLRKGPEFARVEKVSLEYTTYKGEFDSFEVRPSF